jgi:hypothetical protein
MGNRCRSFFSYFVLVLTRAGHLQRHAAPADLSLTILHSCVDSLLLLLLLPPCNRGCSVDLPTQVKCGCERVLLFASAMADAWLPLTRFVCCVGWSFVWFGQLC